MKACNNISEEQTLELPEPDVGSDQLRSDVIKTIIKIFNCDEKDIEDIHLLRKGMTNRSFCFKVKDSKYILRIPGEGTDLIINRDQEAEVFKTIEGHGLCDAPVYIDPESGYKITGFLEGVRTCDAENIEDLQRCMEKLRDFHNMKMTVPHTFDLFEKIEFYESLRGRDFSVFPDYQNTKENVLCLRPFIESLEKDCCLTHIDAVCDNFLFYHLPGESEEQLQLTDWEYAGMQDPHVDIAMFCIYSMFNKAQCDQLIDIYFQDKCDHLTRVKIYAYIAICGLLWSNWGEYKRKLGAEFGEYSLRQYCFAKDYYRYTIQEINKMDDGTETMRR